MRISSSQFYQQSVNGILTRQADAARSQQQLSTGKRILQPSDDPAAAVRSQSLKRDVSALAQYQTNSQQAQNRLQTEEVAVTASIDSVQNIRALILQARNGTQNAGSRAAIAADMQQQLETLVQLANGEDGQGRHLFGGFQEGQPPYVVNAATGAVTYQGDNNQRLLTIGPGRQVSDGDPGSQVFGNVADVANPGQSSDVFALVSRVVTALRTSPADLGTQLADGLMNMDNALTQLSDARTRIGSRLNAVAQQIDINATVSLQFQQTLSSLQDVDYAKVITDYNQQMTGLQAAQQAYARVQGLSLFDYIQ